MDQSRGFGSRNIVERAVLWIAAILFAVAIAELISPLERIMSGLGSQAGAGRVPGADR